MIFCEAGKQLIFSKNLFLRKVEKFCAVFFLRMSCFASPPHHMRPEMLYIFFYLFIAKTNFYMKHFFCSAFTLALSGWMFIILGEH